MQGAKRLSNLPPSFWGSLARTISQLQAQGVDLIRLDVGNPDMPPTDGIIDALRQAAGQPDLHGYAGGKGLPELRNALAEHYLARFGVALDPESEILPLIGSKEGIAHVALAYVDPGDVVLVAEPAYPTYRAGACLAGGEVHVVPLLAERGYLPDLDAIPEGVARRAKLFWFNYPHNPTGATASLSFFQEAVAFAHQHGLVLCHDAPYACVTYEGYRPPSILQVPGSKEVAIEFNSLSKTYNMAGWRVAMAAGGAQVLGPLVTVKNNTDSGIFAPIQLAAVAALRGDQGWLEARNAIYQERRDIVLQGLANAGMAAQKPLAGLYVWAKVPDGQTAQGFVDDLLREQGVSIVPGPMYGQGGEGHVRISVTAPTQRVREAMDRLATFMAGRPPVA